MSAEIGRVARAGTPPTIAAAAVCWALLGGLLLWTALASGSASGADSASVEQIRGTLGDSAVSGPGGGSGGTLIMLALGIVLLVLTVVLLLRRGWAVWPLTIGGVAAIVVLAAGGRWETLVAMLLAAVATLCLMPARSRTFLNS